MKEKMTINHTPHTTQTPCLPKWDTTQSLDTPVTIGASYLTIDEVVQVARYNTPVSITNQSEILEGVQASCDYISKAVEAGKPIYGVTSGFGGMANVAISPELATQLQNNLVQYHKAGAGKPLSLTDIRASMLLRANSHLKGASGIRLEIIRRIETFLNAGVTPYVYVLVTNTNSINKKHLVLSLGFTSKVGTAHPT